MMQSQTSTIDKRHHPFRRAVLRGLALIMPPLLTIVLLLWAWNAIETYVLRPLEGVGRYAVVWSLWDVHAGAPADVPPGSIFVEKDGEVVPLTALFPDSPPPYRDLRKRVAQRGGRLVSFTYDGREYAPVPGNKWIPTDIYETAADNPGDRSLNSALAYYQRYVELEYLRRSFTVPVFLLLFILLLYFLGKFLAAGVGRMLWNTGESVIHRLPIVNTVYSSMKQITDFVFSEQELAFTRVVAVEYPRKGIWSLGFVTGESMPPIREAAGEPVLSVLMPTSPMPATGFTITVRKSEVIDLDITIDQAIQFIVSGGVVNPAARSKSPVARQVTEAVARHVAAGKE